MLRFVFSLLILSCAVPSALAQVPSVDGLTEFVRREFAGQFVTQAEVYRAAARRGWLRTAQERREMKRRLRLVGRLLTGCSRVFDQRWRPAGHLVGAPGPTRTPVLEREFNDSEAYAIELGTLDSAAATELAGRLDGIRDADSYRFVTPADGVVEVTMTFGGTAPYIQVTSASGSENWGFFQARPGALGKYVLPLPKGTYHLRLGRTPGITVYRTTVAFQARNFLNLSLNQTSLTGLGLDFVAFEVVLPADGRLGVDVATTRGADSFLVLLNDQWGYVYDNDDTGASANAGLDALLPKGKYYLYTGADRQVSASIRTTFQAATIPVVTTSHDGTVQSLGKSFELHAIDVPRVARVDLSVAGRGTSPIADSYLQLFDRRMMPVLDSDDSSTSLQSVLSVVLPPGRYYLAATGFNDRGDYQLRMGLRGALPPSARAGTNPVTGAAADEAVTMVFTLATPARAEINIQQGATFDPQVSVLESRTGLSRSWEDDEGLDHRDCNLGMELSAGDYFVIVKNYDGAVGNFDAQILTPLHRFVGDRVWARGRFGTVLYILPSTASAPPSNPFPGLMRGNLLVDLTRALVVTVPMAPNGRLDFRLPLNPGLFLQMAVIDPVRGDGDFSNLLR